MFRRNEDDGFMVFNTGAASARAHDINRHHNGSNIPTNGFHHSQSNQNNNFNNRMPNIENNFRSEEKSSLRKWVNIGSMEKEKGIELHLNDVYKLGNTIVKVKGIYFAFKKQLSFSGEETCGYTKAYTAASLLEKRKGSLKTNINKATTMVLSSKF